MMIMQLLQKNTFRTSNINSWDPHSQQCIPLTGQYEVFLSFRGSDTRKTFADYLYSSLVRSKVCTFRDDEELRKGHKIGPSLVQAIMESKIYIPIFSPNYASSKWCLEELAKIVECCNNNKKRIILPVFYFVEPRDVRNQEGPYREAFEHHRTKYEEQTVEKWKMALREVGAMDGWHVTDSDGHGEVTDKVLTTVWSQLRQNYSLVTDELVGIEHHTKGVIKLLTMNSIIGIHGMGGIGKTTTAKAVFNQVSHHFERCIFLENVREMLARNDGVVSLQKELISTVMGIDSSVRNSSEGVRLIKDRVCRYKTLIVLDDVDETFEFEKILGRIESFYSGSRFVITTRTKKALSLFTNSYELYELGEMSFEHSLELFSKHAFKSNSPPKGLEAMCKKYVVAARRHPLALKVVGSMLFCQDRQMWEEKLVQLEEVLMVKQVEERLKISYNGLSYEEQQIFLDVACFFVGKDKETACHMWRDCKWYPLSVINALVMTSLMEVDSKNQFWMHDHLKDLGKAIVREEDVEHPWKRSRIWLSRDGLHMLTNNKGNEQVQALKINLSGGHCLTADNFQKLTELRYLEIENGELTADFTQCFPNLKWLRMYSCDSVLSNFNLTNLIILDLCASNVRDDWGGWNNIKVSYLASSTYIDMAHKLKAVNLSSCKKLTKAPDLSGCPSLELLNLEHCDSMVGEVNIGNLKNLRVLKLSHCRISKLMGDITTLKHLVEIDAIGSAINQVLIDIDKLPCLEILRLAPKRSCQLSANEVVLPTSLKKLTISTPVSNILALRELEELQFEHCNGLEIPGDLWKLSKSLNYLSITDCNQLQALPSMANSRAMTYLKLSNLGLVRHIHGLGELKILATLDISHAPKLNNLNGLENLENLIHLSLDNCRALDTLPSLARLSKLQRIYIVACRLLTEIRDLNRNMTKLRSLCIRRCPGLRNVERLEFLQGELQRLELVHCPSIERLPRLSRLAKLRTLVLRDNRQLHEIRSLKDFKSLTELTISGCVKLEALPDLSSLKSLKRLYLEGCTQLREITGLESLESLEMVKMQNCRMVETLPNLSRLSKLKELDIGGCIRLTEVSGVEGLESLQVLKMHDCVSVKKLGDLSGLKNLREVNFTGTMLVMNGDKNKSNCWSFFCKWTQWFAS
ncbi:Disease resistance protein L6 [Linum perenne]